MALRVLHFLDTEGFAGTEQHVLTLCKHLGLLGVESTLLCRYDNSNFVVKALGTPHLNVAAAGRKEALISELRSKILGEWDDKPDIIHTHNGRTSLMAARLGRIEAKRVFTQHFVAPAHTEYRWIKKFAAMAAHGMVNARIDKVIAVSEAARCAMIEREHLPEEKIVTIWNGIEPPKVNADYAGQVLRREGFDTHPLFLTIARLAPEKGYHTLLDAVPIVLKEFPKARFVWIGGGELETEMRAAVRERGLQSAILMLGYQDNAANFFACADAFILPSHCEPFGLVLVEAMMCGVPVIGTDCGGAKEIINPDVELITNDHPVGWRVPPKNPEALAQAIIECAAYPGLSQEIAEWGKRRAFQQFTAERMARQTLAIYEELTH